MTEEHRLSGAPILEKDACIVLRGYEAGIREFPVRSLAIAMTLSNR